MIVTGVQPVGAQNLGSVQVAVVDGRDLARVAQMSEQTREPGPGARTVPSQPVVFPREGVPLDQRPVSQRMEHAVERYEQDGGDEDEPDERGGRERRDRAA